MVKATVCGIVTKMEKGEQYVLLTRRNIDPYNGCLCLPGGHIETNETAFNAVRREVNEETGMDFQCNFLFYHDEIIPEENIHAIVLVFTGEGTGKIMPDYTEVSEVVWVKTEESLSFQLAFLHQDILKIYFNESKKKARRKS